MLSVLASLGASVHKVSGGSLGMGMNILAAEFPSEDRGVSAPYQAPVLERGGPTIPECEDQWGFHPSG